MIAKKIVAQKKEKKLLKFSVTRWGNKLWLLSDKRVLKTAEERNK